MRKEYAAQPGAGEVKAIDWKKMVTDADLAVKIIDRQIEERKIDIKGAGIIVAGGYGMGSKENFRLVHELADVLGGAASIDTSFGLLYLRTILIYIWSIARSTSFVKSKMRIICIYFPERKSSAECVQSADGLS